MKNRIRNFLTVLFIIVASLSVSLKTTYADAAPPAAPPGQNLLPGDETTMVQMVAEKVILEVNGPGEIESVRNGDNWVITGHDIDITAIFWMKNQGKVEEQLAVRFPISMDDEYGGKVTVKDFAVYIDGNRVDWWSEPYHDPTSNLVWAHFDVTFPVGQEVVIEVEYTTLSRDSWQAASIDISYILATGAGWYGPIGEGEIILRLPYPANTTNVLLRYSTQGAVFSGDEAIWRFENLEPTYKDNWHTSVLAPEVWQKILDAQETLSKDPDNFNALMSLGAASYEAVINNEDGSFMMYTPEYIQLFIIGETAYARAVEIRPEDINLRVTYAEMLLLHLGGTMRSSDFPSDVPIPQVEEIMAHLDFVIAADPGHELALSLRERIVNIAAALSKTPTEEPSPTPSLTETPKPTQSPSDIPYATPTMLVSASPTDQIEGDTTPNSTLFFGVGIVFVIGFGIGIYYLKRRK
ncbi:MAG: hypothetical protein E3J88_01745 [Anaerolineales bacterium]|nr:MAG: hypothetical protein E3J88_01745 [Anaerolineales bacterium]